MTRKIPESLAGKALAGAAIGSAAIAAALLYAKRKEDHKKPPQLPPLPSGEPPETD